MLEPIQYFLYYLYKFHFNFLYFYDNSYQLLKTVDFS